LREILVECGRLVGRRGRPIRLPHAAVLPVAYVAEGWAYITGRTPRTTVDGVRLSRKHMYFASTRARQELGYESRDAREALGDAAIWFRANGYIR
jgi:dihydroflavonol-4-reductase